MKQINLLKHQGLSFEGFKSWLNQLILNKKGALPDTNDWKLIKQKLDSVVIPKEKIWVDYSNIKVIETEEQLLDLFGVEYTDDERYAPWKDSTDTSYAVRLQFDDGEEWIEVDDMDMEFVEYVNQMIDEVERLDEMFEGDDNGTEENDSSSYQGA